MVSVKLVKSSQTLNIFCKIEPTRYVMAYRWSETERGVEELSPYGSSSG